jgi:hypothetical protein
MRWLSEPGRKPLLSAARLPAAGHNDYHYAGAARRVSPARWRVAAY